MSQTARRIEELGLVLPAPLELPPGVELPFPWVSVRGDRVFVSGHGPQEPDGRIAGPFGKVGAEVTLEEAQELARKTALAVLASLTRELGDLDRITGWCRVFGMVNSAPGFDRQPAVINGFSEVILAVFDADVARHARSAVGMAGLPFGIAVEVEAEVLIAR
jgi:enamine deaminase RidA (YjgF/YER057c/UK114 family)